MALAVLIGLAGALLAARLPLPVGPALDFTSPYGVVDNRRLFLAWYALVVACLAGPLLATLYARRRGRPATAAPESREAPPAPPEALGTGPAPPPPEAPGLAPAAVPASRPRQRGPRSAWLEGLLAVFVVGATLAGPGVAVHTIGGHELIHLGYLNELNLGRQLNVDTRINYGPLLGYSIFGFMKAFSFSLLGFRLYWNVVAALTVLALFFLVRRRLTHRWLVWPLTAALLFFTAARYYLPGTDGLQAGSWGTANLLRHGWVAIALLSLAGPLYRPGAGLAWWCSGAVLALGTWYAQETGPLALVAFGALVSPLLQRPWTRETWRRLVAAAGGAALGAGVLLLPALLAGAPGRLLANTFQGPSLVLRGAANTPYPAPGWDSATVLFHLVPAAVLGLLLVTWSRVLRGERSRQLPFALAIYAALAWISPLARADEQHFFNVTLAPLLLLFLELDRFRWRPPILRALFLVLLPAFFVARPNPVDVARGLGAGWVRGVRPPEGWIRIELPRGKVWVPESNWYDPGMIGKHDTIEGMRMLAGLSGGRPTYIVGNKASLHYFLAAVPCAVEFTDLPSQCTTGRDEAALRSQLARAWTDFVFVSEEYSSAAHREGRGAPGYEPLGLQHAFYVFRRARPVSGAPPPAGGRP